MSEVITNIGETQTAILGDGQFITRWRFGLKQFKLAAVKRWLRQGKSLLRHGAGLLDAKDGVT